jgi:hypothetical protein
MAQKMRFLAEDVGAAREPDRAELQAWYAKHSDEFAQPNRVSFRHLYFSPDRRGSRVRDDAAQALAQLAGQQDSKLCGRSPCVHVPGYYRDRARAAGQGVWAAVRGGRAKLAPRSWQRTLQSGLGWHLVFVDTAVPGRVPAFEEVEAEVKTAWLGEQKALAWQKAYKDMRAKYTVLLPDVRDPP